MGRRGGGEGLFSASVGVYTFYSDDFRDFVDRLIREGEAAE